MDDRKRSVVVTGASSGIGKACVLGLANSGWRVFGTVRKSEDGDRLRSEIGAKVTPIIMDVTDRASSTPSMVTDLESQVADLVQHGARILTGGRRLDRPGNFFQPTVIVDIKPGSKAYYEELFGPVAMLFTVADANEAIRLANDSQFGLGASAWTNDPAEQSLFINELQSGMVFINSMVASDPRLPFGGIKESGFGRELGVYGIREFVNVKTVSIKSA